MKIVRRIIKGVLFLLLVPVLYLLIALLLSVIIVDRQVDTPLTEHSIYLTTNGVHLDIIIPKEQIDSSLLNGLVYEPSDAYLSFGWGDENFYINTPTWADLTFTNACRAMFLKSTTLMHVTRHRVEEVDWMEIKITAGELEKLNTYITDFSN